ncbi:Hydrogen cyanide synthase subunit HcnC [Koleobacter methoxysyntrophicus]|uniref:Hydrogen cyanide synthase subunit HcnC n=1 Tax=Koleobacter methoxysyntrophicus TaxID=2751313 RepID=A0A8A0RLJ2_9FIRM|nr:FAD-dependent oxidoreductase [Koleobacter methoxysyntrophicus]QSQ08379.1 Hydrogen cyanide synthase subunit HcnC [Koleobacter methoxysyntrophicus]
MNKTSEIVIIGGGVIGTSTAYYLSKANKRVTLIEKGDLASGASGACDQDIILQSKNPGIHLKLAMASAELYKTLEAELGHPIEYENTGGMILIETEEEMEIMKRFVKRQQETGLEVEILDRKEASKLQRGLAGHLLGSTYCPQDAHVNSIELTIGFAKAAKRLGAQIMLHTEITGIKQKNGKVTGVKTTKGDIDCELVVNCSGAWAPKIGKMVGIDIPIKPRRGQIVVTEEVPPFVMGDVLSARYIVAKYNPDTLKDSDDPGIKLGVGLSLSQTQKGNILIGATREFVGYDTSVTRTGLKEILKNATRLVPDLKQINIIRMFSGLRPYTPDGLPIIGPVNEPEGFFIAAGHEGDGIALAPITGRIVSGLICGDKLPFNLEELSPYRF